MSMNVTTQTSGFGVHFMLDGYNASYDALKDIDVLTQMLQTLPEKMGMYAISKPLVVEVGPNNKKDPGGISGFVMIAESHISFHTFPGREFVTVDVYTCQDELNVEKFTEAFREVFKFTDQDINYIQRGVRYPSVNTHD